MKSPYKSLCRHHGDRGGFRQLLVGLPVLWRRDDVLGANVGSGIGEGRPGMITGDGFDNREDAAVATLDDEKAGSATTKEGTDGCAESTCADALGVERCSSTRRTDWDGCRHHTARSVKPDWNATAQPKAPTVGAALL